MYPKDQSVLVCLGGLVTADPSNGAEVAKSVLKQFVTTLPSVYKGCSPLLSICTEDLTEIYLTRGISGIYIFWIYTPLSPYRCCFSPRHRDRGVRGPSIPVFTWPSLSQTPSGQIGTDLRQSGKIRAVAGIRCPRRGIWPVGAFRGPWRGPHDRAQRRPGARCAAAKARIGVPASADHIKSRCVPF